MEGPALNAARENAWRRYLKARLYDGTPLYDLASEVANEAGFGEPSLVYFLKGGRFSPQNLLFQAASIVQDATVEELDSSSWPSMAKFLPKLEAKILLRRVYEKFVPGGMTEPKDERMEAKNEAKTLLLRVYKSMPWRALEVERALSSTSGRRLMAANGTRTM